MAEPDWLSEDQLEDWKALMALTLALPSALDAQLKRDSCVTTFEYHVMAALTAAPRRSLPMSVLAALASGSMSRLSHVVARLEKAGWVERQASQLSGCRTEAHLTDAGMRKMEASAPGHVEEVRRLVIDNLSAEELRVLGAAARKIVKVADPRLEDGIARTHEEQAPTDAS